MASRGGLSALALAEMAGGVVLAWSGIENASIAATLTSLLKGQKPAAQTGTEQVVPDVTGAAADVAEPAGGTAGEAPGGSLTAAQNKILGRTMAAAYGWATGNNWAYLESGWEEESGWSDTAQNGTWPGAYGIPQANPGTKLPKSGWPKAEGGSSSASAQIAWGLAYIKATYGAPVNVPNWSANGPLPGYEGY